MKSILIEPSFAMAFNSAPSIFTCDRMQDSIALIAFYDALNGDDWDINTNWNSSNPIDTWYGVFDTDADGCIDALYLDTINLVGQLTSDAINFSKLKELSLFGNQISGTLPTQIGMLSELAYLDLSHNNIANPRFSQLSNIMTLEYIDFTKNEFNNIVELIDLCGLPNLRYLSLRDTDLKNNIDVLECHPNLEYINLVENQIPGNIPLSLFTLSNLNHCLLNNNEFDDTISSEFGQLVNLEVLDLKRNNLKGTVPQSLTNLINLKTLTLSENQLEGSFPYLSSAPLENLRIHDNKFNSFPDYSSIDTWNDDPDLINADWVGCQVQNNALTFDGILPNMGIGNTTNWLYGNQDFIYVDTTFTLLVGQTLTIDLAVDEAITTNQYIWYRNQVPIDTTNANTLVIDSIQEDMAGEYTCEVTNSTVPDLTLYSQPIQVIVGDCRFLDSLVLVKMYNDMSGETWSYQVNSYFDIETGNNIEVEVPNHLNAWEFNEPIDTWYGIKLNDEGCVNSIILDNVGLTGKLLDEIGNLQSLEKLYLLNNHFSDSLPNTLYQLTNLKELVLFNNSITGNISPQIGNLTNLVGIDLTLNNLTGNIPIELEELTKLKRLYLGENNLAGAIPNELASLNELVHLYLCCNGLDGFLPDSLGRFTQLITLDVSNNNLSGPLPDSFTELESLLICFLHNNELTGTISESISNLQNLRFLQLQHNNFEGVFPNSAEDMMGLRSIRIDSNFFSGDFPDLSHLALEVLRIDNNQFESFPNYASITTWDPDTISRPWTGCQVQNNKLTFEDILPNMEVLNTTVWNYAPQDSFFADTIIEAAEGEDITIDLGIDESIENNKYTWYKDGNQLVIGETLVILDSNKLVLNNISLTESGEYWCHVTNDSVPDLTLKSRIISIQITTENIGNESDYNPLLTPNGDGFNDILEFEALTNYPKNSITIFNRYGETVFEETPYLNNWKGAFQGSENILPDATYYYVLILGDAEKILKGYITILSK